MSSTLFLKALGLVTQPNHLGNEPGSLLDASNIIIRRDNIVESRRGFKNYGDDIGSVSDRASQLVVYKDRILRHYTDVLQYDTQLLNFDGESIFDSFSGSFNEVDEGLRIKFLEANGNLYFTTSDGVKKISAVTAADFTTASGYIINAGGIKALNLQARLKTTLGDVSSFFPANSVVAYRVVWGITDRNNNVILGSPSEQIQIYNPFTNLTLGDFSNLLNVLDQICLSNGSVYDDADYVSTLNLPNTASASQLRTNLIALSTKLDQDEGVLFTAGDIISASVTTQVCTITLSANVGIFGKVSVDDKIYLSGNWIGFGDEDLSGIQTVSSVTATTITFSAVADDGAVALSGESIESGWFRSISEPDAILGIVPTAQESQNLADYLESIITELQSNHNIIQIIDNDGAATAFPAELISVALSGTAATVTTSAPADLRDIIQNTNLIYLNGTFTGATPSINGVQTVNGTAITATVFEFDSTSTGVVTIDTTSQIQKIQRFSNDLQTTYINGLGITESSTVILDIVVPTDATLNHFYQIYRTPVTTAIGTDILSDLSAGDEEQLVFEAYPTQAELDARLIQVEDVVTDTFLGAFLYTNATTGEGILQANDVPPLAKDINRYKTFTFYANTSTRQRLSLSLLGVDDLISEYNAGRTPSIVVSTEDGVNSNVYSFITGEIETTPITFSAELAGNYTGKYFTINTANNINKYYVWYEVSGSGSDPMVAGRFGIKVVIDTADTAIEVATKTRDVLNSLINDFSAENSGTAILTINNKVVGFSDDATVGTLTGVITIGVIIQGQGEQVAAEESQFTCSAGAGLAGLYFTVNTAYDRDRYYVWYLVNGGGVDPMVANSTGIPVDVLSTDTSTQVAEKTKDVLNALDNKFIATSLANILTIKNYHFGPATDATAATSTFSLVILVQGALNVLLSESISPAQAIEETARSFVDVINKNTTEVINAFYLSGLTDVPGKMLLEARNLSVGNFYLLANKDVGSAAEVGESFNPTLTPTNVLTTPYISIGNPTTLTSTNHGLINGNQIILSGTNSVPNIDGVWTITKLTANTFTIPIQVVTAGTKGSFTKLSDALNLIVSNNEVRPNRLYYSKSQQPEAVPIVNFLDVGAQDQAILRIMPLRDSLFIFKEDGLFRLSGDVIPFNVALFDSSTNLLCPDSVSVTNNSIYGWTNKGIEAVTESGVNTISRPIDVDILPKNSLNFPSFITATWGVGYDSDNSYIVWTVDKQTDTVATIAYLFHTLTNTWTIYDKSNTCGLVNPVDNKLYLGSGVRNKLEQERKDFARTDYADREFNTDLTIGNYLLNGLQITLDSVADYKIGDVLTQLQYLTVYEFNSLLKKLDIDIGLTNHDYYALLNAVGGDSLRDKLANPSPTLGLAAKLDADPDVDNTDYLFTIDTKMGSIYTNSADEATIISLLNKTFAPGDVNTGTNVITIATHGFNNDDRVTFTSTGTLPGGLVAGTVYYIITAMTNTFQISLTEGGSAVDLTTTGSGTHKVLLSHDLQNDRIIQINNSNSFPLIDGIYQVTVIDANSFSIPITVITEGNAGSYITVDTNFQDIAACYNAIVVKLNLDIGLISNNYQENNTTTLQETIITAINPHTRTLTLNLALPFVLGKLTIYESIISSFTYSPVHFGDPISLKHIREAQIFFEDMTFTSAKLSFASDLLPVLNDVMVPGLGNGIFGHKDFGDQFFGGAGNMRPFRTYVPRNNQRCTYITLKFEHRIAREHYSLYGMSLTGEVGPSTRAYR